MPEDTFYQIRAHVINGHFVGLSNLAHRNPAIKTLRICGIEEYGCENGVSSRSQEAYQQKYMEMVDIAASLRGSLVRK